MPRRLETVSSGPQADNCTWLGFLSRGVGHGTRCCVASMCTNQEVSGRQPTVLDTRTAAWSLESSLVAWYARAASDSTAALSWRSVRGRCRCKSARWLVQLAGDTEDVDISQDGRAGGEGEPLLLLLVLHAAICSIIDQRRPRHQCPGVPDLRHADGRHLLVPSTFCKNSSSMHAA